MIPGYEWIEAKWPLFFSAWIVAPSAAAKKAACKHPEASEEKGGRGEGQKEGQNGEVDEESNGAVKESEGAACGSKQRACRRPVGGEGSDAGTEHDVLNKTVLDKMTLQEKCFRFTV